MRALPQGAPQLVRLAKETAALGVHFLGIDIRVLGIDIRDSKSAALAFERDHGIGYPSLDDPDARTMLGFKGLAPRPVPTPYVLDHDRRVAAYSIGPLTYREFLPIVQGITAEKQP